MTTKQTTKQQQSRYIRLSPVVLYRVPDCYATKSPDMNSDACVHCFLRKWCGEKAEVEWR